MTGKSPLNHSMDYQEWCETNTNLKSIIKQNKNRDKLLLRIANALDKNNELLEKQIQIGENQ